jgi:hypothetical protein
VEAFDLPVRLRAVGPGPLVHDAELDAGIAPGMGLVGRPVVGLDPFDDHPAGGENNLTTMLDGLSNFDGSRRRH